MNAVESIQAVINTLNVVSVSGVENMNRMLGSIQTLARVKEELGKEAKPHEEDRED